MKMTYTLSNDSASTQILPVLNPNSLTSLTTVVCIEFIEKLWNHNTVKEEFEDTKEVIRNRISKKNRKHNGQKKKV